MYQARPLKYVRNSLPLRFRLNKRWLVGLDLNNYRNDQVKLEDIKKVATL